MDVQVAEESAKEEGELSDDGEVITESGRPRNDDKSISARTQRSIRTHQDSKIFHKRADSSSQYTNNRYDHQSRKYDRSPEHRRYPDSRRERNENDRQDGNDSGRSGFWARRRHQQSRNVPRKDRRPLAAVPLPSLLTMPLPPIGHHYLNAQPPPPPPPPPPPLPSSPPPAAPEPPPLYTPRFTPGVKNPRCILSMFEIT